MLWPRVRESGTGVLTYFSRLWKQKLQQTYEVIDDGKVKTSTETEYFKYDR